MGQTDAELTRMKLVPTYNLRAWKLASADENKIVFRPGLFTAVIRARYAIAVAILFLCVEFALRAVPDPPMRSPHIPEADRARLTQMEQQLRDDMRETMTEAEYRDFERRIETQQQDRLNRLQEQADQSRQRLQWITNGARILFGSLFGLALLAPISCLWARMTVTRDVRGEISLFSWGVIPRWRRWPQDHFERITTWAMERYWFTRHGDLLNHAWEWHVVLSPKGLPSMPYTGDVALSNESPGPQFLVSRQKHQPTSDERAPEKVRQLVKALRSLTGLPADPPKIIEGEASRGWFRPKVTRRASHTMDMPISTQTHTQTFNSIDEIPPELRERFAEMLRSGNVTRRPDGTLEASTSRVIHSETFSGDEIDANLDRLPPEIREQVERLRGKRR